MPRLPSVSDNHTILQADLRGAPPDVIANPFMQLGSLLGDIGQRVHRTELDDAERQGQNAVYYDQDGNLQATFRDGTTDTVRAYNHAVQVGYTAKLMGDIRLQGQQQADAANGNPAVFNPGWQTYSKMLLKNVPERLQGSIAALLQQEGARYSLGVSEVKRRRDIAVSENDAKAGVESLSNDTAVLARGGGTNTPDYQAKIGQLRSLYQNMVANPDFTMSQKQADIELGHIESRNMAEAMAGTVMQTFKNKGAAAAQQQANSILTDTSLNLSPAERRQYNGIMNETINGMRAQQKVDLIPFQQRAKTMKDSLAIGNGIDDPAIDDVVNSLSRGGDPYGALELRDARRRAIGARDERSSTPAQRLQMAEALTTHRNILSAMRNVESGGDGTQVSRAGALGSMQVMPETGAEIARSLGDKNFPFSGSDAEKKAYLQRDDVSERYGEAYYTQMLQRYGGDQQAALIAYNGGPARADSWLSNGRDDSVIPKETADYYKKVLGQAGASTGRTMGQAGPSAARAFLLSVTNKSEESIDNMQEGFGNKIAALLQAAPAGMREKLGIFSGARTPERQAEIIAENAARYGLDPVAWQRDVNSIGPIAAGQKWAAQFKQSGMSASIAKPGASNHQKGTAADLSYNGQSLKNAPPEVVNWLHQNASRFGLKFPLANENWHIEDSSTRGGGPVSAASNPAYGSSFLVDPAIVKYYQDGVTADTKAAWPDIKHHLEQGYSPDPQEFSIFTRQLAIVNDPVFKQEVSDFMQGEIGGRAVADLPPQQRAAAISALQADAVAGSSIAQQNILDTATRYNQQIAEGLKNDPIGLAAQRGWAPAVPALDFSAGTDAIGAAMAARQKAVDLLRARGEVGNISALRPDDTTMLSNFIQTAKPSDQAALLGTLSRSLSPDTYKATMADLATKADTNALATAGALYAENPEVAQSVIRGRALLQANPNFGPKKSDANNESIDQILPPTSFGAGLEGGRQQLLEAAKARYADLSNFAGDTSGELNSTRMTQAINDVTGGTLTMNGDTVIAPRRGMTQDQFDFMMKNLPADKVADAMTADGTAITANNIWREGRLKSIADGQYLVAFGIRGSVPLYAQSAPVQGDSRLSRVSAGPFILDLRKDSPPVRPADNGSINGGGGW
ncbi:transglycosylase SLT domain-containing protein [Rhizobium sp. SYY.PMSO]|uniref:transglycosylase SLT domain-containing protein n=1 Tax=Rhizobium sp. SYY.PMSO TaxID=3382192 RepID=UPI00398FD5E1